MISMEVINMIKTYRVEGMTCMHCVHHVKEALTELEGVKDAKVSLDSKTAVLDLETDIAFDTIKAAVEKVGYQVFEK